MIALEREEALTGPGRVAPLRVALRPAGLEPAAASRLAGTLRAAGVAVLVEEGAAPQAVLAELPPPDGHAAERGPPWLVLADGVPAMLRALRAGAHGVLPRAAPAAQVAAALEAVAAGAAVLPPELLRGWLGPAPAEEPGPGGEAPEAAGGAAVALTPREREVLDLLAAGASNKVIARRLGLSFHTAKAHVASVLQKLGAGSRADAVARGARAGLVLL